ncbi:hypothetical protein BH09ACT1_BH09ACT1_22300 [soil metagenome]
MLSLAYVSSAAVAFTDDDIADVLALSRSNNARLDITGVLLYRDGRFIQILEGPDDVVRAKFAVIAADERHRGIHTVSEESVDTRQFPEWTMGYRPLTDAAVSRFPDYDDFFDGKATSSDLTDDGRRAQMLLEWLRDYWLAPAGS